MFLTLQSKAYCLIFDTWISKTFKCNLNFAENLLHTIYYMLSDNIFSK